MKTQSFLYGSLELKGVKNIYTISYKVNSREFFINSVRGYDSEAYPDFDSAYKHCKKLLKVDLQDWKTENKINKPEKKAVSLNKGESFFESWDKTIKNIK